MFNPEKPKVKRAVEWRRIGRLFLPYWKEQAMVLFLTLIVSLIGLVPPLLTMKIIDDAVPAGNFNLVLIYVGGMVLSALAAGFVGVYQGFLNSLVGEGIVRDLRVSLVSHLHRMPLDFFTSTRTGEIMNRVSNDVESVDGVLTGTVISVVTNLFIMITTLVTIFILDWRLALLSIAVIPAMIFPMWPVGRRMYEIRSKTRVKRDEIGALTQETLSISGITLIKSFVRELHEQKRFFELGTSLMDSEIQLAMAGRWFLMIITAMVTIGPATVWLFGGWLAIHKGLTIGVVVTFVTLLTRLYTPASALAGIQVQVVSALAVFERIFDYLDMKEEASSQPDETGKVAIDAVQGKIEFDHVSFAYSENRPALKDLTFAIQPGQMVALVGSSGAGKTTISQLVPRFYDPQTGRVLVDDLDIRDLKLSSLRSHIGIVTQETYLFHDTIENNLRYARPDAGDEELVAACRAAHIHEFVESLPEKYKTVVGERGHKLSGGERQRLAIARVLLKNPKILILDEATSSLDSVNEALIQQAFIPLMQGRTSVVIAHRLSTILRADRILVVEHGELIEQGTHQELLALDGYYANLYRHQLLTAETDTQEDSKTVRPVA
ncbi:MAG TPA: ABC transporter ATP-binding protein [Chroococcales cyanobacterium]